MKKLVLSVDKLQVESFAAEPDRAGERLLRNAEGANQLFNTPDMTCRDTCDPTCETFRCFC